MGHAETADRLQYSGSACPLIALLDPILRILAHGNNIRNVSAIALHDTESTDQEIRAALHRKALRRKHGDPSVVVVDELGLRHGRARIDVAVLDSTIHGFEIKSSRDTLRRLASQLSIYEKCLDRFTVVAAPAHLDELLRFLPHWCGIVAADKGPRGAINFFTLRRPLRNPMVDPYSMAHLLWKSEAIAFLNSIGIRALSPKSSRAALYQLIAESTSVPLLKDFIKKSLAARAEWRAGEVQHISDG